LLRERFRSAGRGPTVEPVLITIKEIHSFAPATEEESVIGVVLARWSLCTLHVSIDKHGSALPTAITFSLRLRQRFSECRFDLVPVFKELPLTFGSLEDASNLALCFVSFAYSVTHFYFLP
jgi:hypothetical protein